VTSGISRDYFCAIRYITVYTKLLIIIIITTKTTIVVVVTYIRRDPRVRTSRFSRDDVSQQVDSGNAADGGSLPVVQQPILDSGYGEQRVHRRTHQFSRRL